MALFLLAYLGGVLTIVSPCILPVLPFVFARADRPFVRSGLPMLVGMAVTFAAIATLAAVAGGWAVEANQYGRAAAVVLLALFGLTLVFPGLADRLARPLVALGARLSQSVEGTERPTVVPSLLLGVATGLLWAPCAGPVLGLILTGAALQGASIGTSLLLLAYAAGAATSLALALLVGGRVFAAMKRSLGAGEWIRRGLGVAVLAAVVAIMFGLDTGILTRVSTESTASLEQGLLDRFGARANGPSSVVMNGGAMNGGAMMAGNNAMMGGPAMMKGKSATQDADLAVEGSLPSFAGASTACGRSLMSAPGPTNTRIRAWS
jgi:cytochrome c biogenesis protein CcdA